ncbi:MAG: hypothetical protein R3F59_32285 [Myxococcota bacterium]
MSDLGRQALVAHGAASRAVRGFWNVPPPVREELVQEAVLRLLLTGGADRPDRFAVHVVRRLAIDWLRRVRPVPLDGEVAERTPWADRVEARLALGRVQSALAGAPAHHREALLLCADEVAVAELARTPLLRDRWYKRRRRAIRWLREALPCFEVRARRPDGYSAALAPARNSDEPSASRRS